MTASALKISPVKSGCRKRWLLRISLGAVTVLVVVLIGCLLSRQVLTVDDGPVKADVIVVLGGEQVKRAERAVELFKKNEAARILVSGFGDCQANDRFLIKCGVPEAVITMECDSRTTRENAKFSVPLLQNMGAHRVIIVTAWYHSRRALACFQKYGRGIQFYSEPVRSTEDGIWPGRYERRYVFQEYCKLAWYWVRFGVCPLLTTNNVISD